MKILDYTFGLLIAVAFILVATKAVALDSREQDQFCLAQNIYFEAGNQPLVGKIAVSQVVINRVEDKQFPDTICGVVYQSKLGTNWRGQVYPLRNKCQFSWYCDGKSDKPTDSKTWLESVLIAEKILENYYPDITEEALWYHADSVNPYWSKQLNRTVTIDNHLFYN
jgi:N-acetylmuramoyl-L-alanine amidase